jgi:hypothetical protein
MIYIYRASIDGHVEMIIRKPLKTNNLKKKKKWWHGALDCLLLYIEEREI